MMLIDVLRTVAQREPARVVAVVLAVIGVLSAFGLGITEGQTAAVVALVASVLALAGGEATRSQVTPVALGKRRRTDDAGRGELRMVMIVALGVLVGAVLFVLLRMLL